MLFVVQNRDERARFAELRERGARSATGNRFHGGRLVVRLPISSPIGDTTKA